MKRVVKKTKKKIDSDLQESTSIDSEDMDLENSVNENRHQEYIVYEIKTGLNDVEDLQNQISDLKKKLDEKCDENSKLLNICQRNRLKIQNMLLQLEEKDSENKRLAQLLKEVNEKYQHMEQPIEIKMEI